jgi:DNA adenine methylase
MVELDEQVGAVWQVILADADWLADRMVNFRISLDNVKEALASPPHDLRKKAFQTILRNRVQRGGIMAPGASLMKAGENGRGISSRWYPVTLAKRIQAINRQRKRITFINGDAFDVIPEFLDNPGVAFFIDPPYTAGGKKAGKRLYNYSEIDHEGLFAMMGRAKGEFLMSYDDSKEVEELAGRHGFYLSKVPMKSTHHSKQFELLITSRARIVPKFLFDPVLEPAQGHRDSAG